MAIVDDVATLHSIGQDFIQAFVSVTVETFFFGTSKSDPVNKMSTHALPAIYTILFLYASQLLW